MFSEMGLGTFEQRDKLVKKLSINMVDSTFEKDIEVKTSNNTLIIDNYA